MRKVFATVLAGLLLNPGMLGAAPPPPAKSPKTATPIKHLVIIFQENVSFDHYFGTYPVASNGPGEPKFHAAAGTPTVNELSNALLHNNPNLNPANGAGATNPFRFSRAEAATQDQNHDYTAEQQAFDNGLMDLFPEFTGTPGPPPSAPPMALTTGQTMGYYDGNTVTAYWNYAQHYSMSDNSYGTDFGPSTVGAINLISGQTNGAVNDVNGSGALIGDGNGGLTDVGDADPGADVCSTTTGETFQMSGANIGNLLNAAGISWGFFEGGFNLSIVNSNGTTGCHRSTTSAVTGVTKADYIPHHQPFQYYPSTANPTHVRPSSVAAIGQTDGANHQYDTLDFFAAVQAGNFPAVSFLKAPGFQDGHPGYSDPLDEQKFVVDVINFLQSQPEWSSTAVVINYDDSDGWYDHQLGAIVNTSASADDALTGPGACGTGATALPGVSPNTLHAQGRCGYGPRLPYIVISNYATSTGMTAEVVTAAPTFTVSANPTTVSISRPGGTGSTTLTFTGINGFSGTIPLSASLCSAMPSETTCSFSTGSVALSSTITTATATLTFQTTAPSAALPQSKERPIGFGQWQLGGNTALICVFCVGILLAGFRAGRRRWSAALTVLAMALLLVINSCGGGGSSGGGGVHNPGTPAGSDPNVVITFSVAGVTPAPTVNLAVNVQ